MCDSASPCLGIPGNELGSTAGREKLSQRQESFFFWLPLVPLGGM